MKIENVRLTAEILGITALVISMVFVGLEIKQTSDMNLAQLHYDRLSLFHQHQLAVLESEPALSLVAKRSTDMIWDSEGLTELERGAAITQAAVWLQNWYIEYRFIELGFPLKSIDSLKADIRDITSRYPEIEALFEGRWQYPGDEEYGATGLIREVLGEPDRED